ncbi:MAG: hypothetical protein Q8P12_01595, partial [bacterium]|nr:hypothetical protein [bacterium]
MESRKFANEELKVKLAQKSAERDRWERVTDAATGKTVFWDKDRIGQPGYLPVPVNLRDVTPEGIQKTAESFRKIVGEKTWLDRHFQAGLSAAQQEAENSGLEKPITDYIKTWAGKDFDTSGGTEFERAFSVQHGRKPTADELKRFRKESGQGQVTSEINQLRADLLRMQMSGQLTGEQRLKAIFELRQLATKRATDFDDLEN